MDVVLKKQVKKLGNPGDIVAVNPGYARNYLIAKGLADFATPQAIAQAAALKKKKTQQRVMREGKNEALKTALEGQTILVRASANEEGHLYGGVGPEQIAETIAKRKKIRIDPKHIDATHHIKALGRHAIDMKLRGGESLRFYITVERAE